MISNNAKSPEFCQNGYFLDKMGESLEEYHSKLYFEEKESLEDEKQDTVEYEDEYLSNEFIYW